MTKKKNSVELCVLCGELKGSIAARQTKTPATGCVPITGAKLRGEKHIWNSAWGEWGEVPGKWGEVLEK
ncbi:MAG: hypothetical protein IKJ10_11380 [Bacteroidaceae bacterium]|nr:hypothetical protein [Bacteroidaceae bacterium]